MSLAHMTVNSLCFSPCDKLILTGCSDGTLNIWDVDSRTKIIELMRHPGSVTSVCYSVDGKFCATGCLDNIARVFDMGTTDISKKINGHSKGVNSVCFSPNRNHLVTASDDCTVSVVDVNTGGVIRGCKKHTEGVRSACFSPCGKYVLTGSNDNTVALLRVCNGDRTIFKGLNSAVHSVCFSHDGLRIAAGGVNNTVRIWDVTTHTILETLTGHNPCQNGICSVRYSGDGKTILTGSGDGTAKLWDSVNTTEIITLQHKGSVWSACYSPFDDMTIATGSEDSTVRLWDVRKGGIVATLADGHSNIGDDGTQYMTPVGNHIVRYDDATPDTTAHNIGDDGTQYITPVSYDATPDTTARPITVGCTPFEQHSLHQDVHSTASDVTIQNLTSDQQNESYAKDAIIQQLNKQIQELIQQSTAKDYIIQQLNEEILQSNAKFDAIQQLNRTNQEKLEQLQRLHLKLCTKINENDINPLHRIKEGDFHTVTVAQYNDRLVVHKEPRQDQSEMIALEKLRREVASLLLLRHPCIVPLVGATLCPAGSLKSVVTEYVQGGNAEEMIKHHKVNGTQPCMLDILSIAIDVASALAYCHSRGVYHGDVKPSNILLRNGRALLGDFGSATGVDIRDGAPAATSMEAAGSSKYWSGEANDRSAEGDMYSLGFTLLEIASGDLISSSKIQSTKLRNVDKAVIKAFKSCISKDRGARSTAEQLLEVLISAHKRYFPYLCDEATDLSQSKLVSTSVPTIMSYPLLPTRACKTLLKEADPACIEGLQIHQIRHRSGDLMFEAFRWFWNMIQTRTICHYGPDRIACRSYEDDVYDDFGKDRATAEVVDHRKKTMDMFRDRACGVLECNRYPTSDVKLLRVYHSTTMDKAKLIMNGGFISFSSLDPGFFGKGLYFSPDLAYVRNVYHKKRMEKWIGEGRNFDYVPVILCCYVVVRHVFPVTSMNYLGQANRGGYDTHVAVVQHVRCYDYKPVPPSQWLNKEVYVEVVVFQASQILPVATMFNCDDDEEKK